MLPEGWKVVNDKESLDQNQMPPKGWMVTTDRELDADPEAKGRDLELNPEAEEEGLETEGLVLV